MAGHSLTITIQSTGQVDQINLTPEAVELLLPGTPEESVHKMTHRIKDSIDSLIAAKRNIVLSNWAADNVTVST